MIEVRVNGKPVRVREGTTAAAAVLISGESVFRRSAAGEPRGPLCGMGVCFECLATIDGRPRRRSCQTLCRGGMAVETAPDER
jgi:sarcosine oxidase subunit alpha